MQKAVRLLVAILVLSLTAGLVQGCNKGGEEEKAGKVGEITGLGGAPLSAEAKAALEKSKSEPKEASPFQKGAPTSK